MSMSKRLLAATRWRASGRTYSAEANAYFSRLSALGTPIPNIRKPLYDATYADLNTLGRDGLVSIKDSLLGLYIQPVSKNAALQNLLVDLYNGTPVSDYAGSFVQDEGLKGNGSFAVNRNFNPSVNGGAKFSQNSACFGLLCLDDTPENTHDWGGLLTGSTGSYIKVRDVSGSSYGTIGEINGVVASTLFPTNASARCWLHIERTSSASFRININGFRILSVSAVSATLANIQFYEFAANVAGTLSAFSTKTHAVAYIGNGNVEQNTLMKILNRSFLFPYGNPRTAIRNRVLFFGDSMTGDETVATKALSVNSRYAIRTQANLGSDWLCSVNGNANRELLTSNTVPSTPGVLVGSPDLLQLEVIGTVAGAQQAFRNNSFTKDVICWFGCTNDAAFHAITDAAAIYAGLVTMGNRLKAEGFKFIITGMPARNGGYLNSQNTAGFNAVNADYRSRMQAVFNVPTAVPHVYAPSAPAHADLWIDIYEDTEYQNTLNTNAFQADEIHLNQTGLDRYSDNMLAPALAIV